LSDREDRPSLRLVDPRHLRTGEGVERALLDRPARTTLAEVADWLAGPVLGNESGARAFDEFASRMLAAGFPLLRFSIHSGTLHPQSLGATFGRVETP
jgi:hypothetical protein